MKILILSNHYLTLRVFRKDLIHELSKNHEVVISLPEDKQEYMDELRSFGARLVYEKNMDRRAINPIEDLKLISSYKKLLKTEKPDKVITYTIKCNIYGAWACKSQNIPCYCNITGLGSAFYNDWAAQNDTTLTDLIKETYYEGDCKWILTQTYGDQDIGIQEVLDSKYDLMEESDVPSTEISIKLYRISE